MSIEVQKFTTELKRVLHYIKSELIKRFPTKEITLYHYIVALLETDFSVAHKLLDKFLFTNQRTDLFKHCREKLVQLKAEDVDVSDVRYSEDYDKCVERAEEESLEPINSTQLLTEIIKYDNEIAEMFKRVDISVSQLQSASGEKRDNSIKRIISIDDINSPMDGVLMLPTMDGQKDLVNLNKAALRGGIDIVYGNDDVINTIFRILLKCENNNVLLVGGSGVGKTATVKHIANLLAEDNVPDAFKGKELMMLDFISLLSSAYMRGALEKNIKNIINDAKKKNSYIFFIDDIQSILNERGGYGDVDTAKLIDMILSEPNIPVIATSSDRGYSHNVGGSDYLKRKFQKVSLAGKNVEETIEILKKCKSKYEDYHEVEYDDTALCCCATNAKKYIKDGVLPGIAIDILDEAGAKCKMETKKDEKLVKLQKKMDKLTDKAIAAAAKHKSELYEKLSEDILSVQSKIEQRKKELSLKDEKPKITEEDILDIISMKTNVSVNKIRETEREKLLHLDKRLSEQIIGQQDAVSTVCKSVRRRRIGISKKDKPVVLMFVGQSGVGKTYLAKKLSECVFGENSIVRLDMSEYSDRISATKIVGASAGYIGYENGGVLTEAVKRNNHCVLLLDEIEKACDEVLDVFLQLFDEGRLSDNRGVEVDFSNVIVIMTSNIGVKESNLRGDGIGFVKNNLSESIIRKEMSNKFRPEFLNRVDNIIMFNHLSDDNLKDIILLELNSLKKRLNDIKYDIDDKFIKRNADAIFRLLKDDKQSKDYGARPILRLIQEHVEDKLTDYIIQNDPPLNSILKIES